MPKIKIQIVISHYPLSPDKVRPIAGAGALLICLHIEKAGRVHVGLPTNLYGRLLYGRRQVAWGDPKSFQNESLLEPWVENAYP